MLLDRHWDLASWQSFCIDLAHMSFESRLHSPFICNVSFAFACGVDLFGIGIGDGCGVRGEYLLACMYGIPLFDLSHHICQA